MVLRLGLWIPLLWLPLCVREYYAPQKSKRMLDRYNIYVLALGHFFHLIWGTEDIDDWIFGFLGALGVELLLWEGFGNSPLVAKRIRDEIGNFGAGAFKIYHIIEGCGSSLNFTVGKQVLVALVLTIYGFIIFYKN